MSVLGSIYYGIKNLRARRAMKAYVQDMINNLLKLHADTEDPEIREVCNYYKNGGTSVFPYNIEESYDYHSLKYKTTHTNGYILFYFYRNLKPPYLRRCIITATNIYKLQ